MNHERDTPKHDTGIPAGDSDADAQTGMSSNLGFKTQTGTSVSLARRNLPHWRRAGSVYWVTFRLGDSLPQTKLLQLRSEKDAWRRQNPEPWTDGQQCEYEAQFGERVQQWLDAGYGSCALAQTDIRNVVRRCLTRFDGDRLHLHAAVIMPNHVHALIEPQEPCDTGIPAGDSDSEAQTGMSSKVRFKAQTGMSVSPVSSGDSLSRLLKSIKGASARAANLLLGKTGTFWMDESYDRIVRNGEEYHRFVEYIRANPAKADLSKDRYWLHCPAPK
jgi:REP element-mobilizing transposase RayT